MICDGICVVLFFFLVLVNIIGIFEWVSFLFKGKGLYVFWIRL